MVETGEADAHDFGTDQNYPDTIRPAIEIIGNGGRREKNRGHAPDACEKGPLFLADTTVNFNPTAEELADITLLAAKEVRHFDLCRESRC